MPVYNAAPYLPKAIESVLCQTYTDFELIICDNCSTDASAEIAEQYASQDDRIRFRRNGMNLGYAGNLQRTASYAAGTHILFQFADDGAQPHAVQRLLETAEQYSSDSEDAVIISDTYVWSQDEEITGVIALHPDRLNNWFLSVEEYESMATATRVLHGHEILACVMPQLDMSGFIGGTLFSRGLFERVGQVTSTRSHNPDKQFMYKLMATDTRVVRLNEPLFFVRMHDSNQHAQDRSAGVIKQAVDDYAFTYEFAESFLNGIGLSRRSIATGFVDKSCLRKALTAVRDGAPLLGFRYLAFALATYPQLAVRNPKFFAALAGVLAGPIGRVIAENGYRAGLWRRRESEDIRGPGRDQDRDRQES